ncbi:unnamed protein product [Closterium sp. NIES-53]
MWLVEVPGSWVSDDSAIKDALEASWSFLQQVLTLASAASQARRQHRQQQLSHPSAKASKPKENADVIIVLVSVVINSSVRKPSEASRVRGARTTSSSERSRGDDDSEKEDRIWRDLLKPLLQRAMAMGKVRVAKFVSYEGKMSVSSEGDVISQYSRILFFHTLRLPCPSQAMVIGHVERSTSRADGLCAAACWFPASRLYATPAAAAATAAAIGPTTAAAAAVATAGIDLLPSLRLAYPSSDLGLPLTFASSLPLTCKLATITSSSSHSRNGSLTEIDENGPSADGWENGGEIAGENAGEAGGESTGILSRQ